MQHGGSLGGATGAVVIGGGHNGLICATYLARAGIAVTVIEARGSVGGNAASEEALGAVFNVCNCDHTMIRSTPIIDELGLAGHGLRYLDSELSQVNVHWDGSPAWYLFHDLERTVEGLRQTHPAQADAYARYARAAVPIARTILELANAAPTPGSVLPRTLRRPRSSAELLLWSRRTAVDVLRGYFSSEALLGPALTTGPIVWGITPDLPGTGLGAITYAIRHAVLSGRPIGGSGALPAALERAFLAAGGTILRNTRVTNVVCESGAVVGVRTDQGELRAPIVVCAADARTALVDWLSNPPPQASALVRRYREQPQLDGYESKVDAVIDSRFRYRSASDASMSAVGITHTDAQHATAIVSLPLAEVTRAYQMKQEGRVAERPMFYTNTPSVKDPSVGRGLAAGEDVFSLEILWTPYALAGGWEGSAEPVRWLRRFGDLVETESGRPFADTVRRHRHMGPVTYERQFSMTRGYAPSYSGTPLSALLGRDRELSRYATPVRGLFLTGAGTFPGAGVWGAAGRNAAAAVLRSDARSRSARRSAGSV